MYIQKNFLTNQDSLEIEKAIENFEITTGAELVIAVAKESDPYPGATFRGAIILGFIISSIISFIIPKDFNSFNISGYFIIIFLLLPLSKLNIIKKLFIDSEEKEREVKEKAIEFFYKLCTTQTNHKTSTFLFISILEKKIELLVDEELKTQFSQEDLNKIVTIISDHFKKHEFKIGLIESIETLREKILKFFPEKCNQIAPNEIKNKIHWID